MLYLPRIVYLGKVNAHTLIYGDTRREKQEKDTRKGKAVDKSLGLNTMRDWEGEEE